MGEDGVLAEYLPNFDYKCCYLNGHVKFFLFLCIFRYIP